MSRGILWIREYGKSLQPKWEQLRRPLWLGSCFLMVGLFAFEAGILRGELTERPPLILRTPAVVPAAQPTEKSSPVVMPKASSVPTAPSPADSKTCALVGSKKSNKYHSPNSRCAKQINPENRICFADADAAIKRGYQPGCLE